MKAYLEMEMPKSCYYCPMANDGFYLCKATSPFKELEDDCEERRPDWCPLIPIPAHGDLVERDWLLKNSWRYAYMLTAMEAAPIIIPASGEGET